MTTDAKLFIACLVVFIGFTTGIPTWLLAVPIFGMILHEIITDFH